jgi:undecaprenyl-diphosphatase
MTLFDIDTSIVESIADMRNAPLTDLFTLITDVGGEASIAAATLVACFLLWRAGGRAWAGLLVSVGGGIGAGYALKELIARGRPDETLRAVVETGYSFPSLHATAAVALYGFLLWVLYTQVPAGRVQTTLAVLLVFFIFAIGTSRIYLGVHYPSDVVAGFALGALFAWLGTMTVRRFAGGR